MKLPDKIKLRKLHNENSKRHVPIPTNEAQELQGLDGCIQHLIQLQARLLSRESDFDFVTTNFSLWKALFAELQIVPNLTRLAEIKEGVLPPVELLKIWERELRARVVQKRSELQLRGLMLTVPALVVAGIEQEAAQRICSFAYKCN